MNTFFEIRRIPLVLLSLLMLVLLPGCFWEDDDPAPAPIPDANPTGYYDQGTLSVAGGTITDTNLLTMISGNRIMMTSLASSNAGTDETLVYDGTMVVTKNDFTADMTVYKNGENSAAATMTGTITEGSQITNGTLTGTGVGSGTFSLTYSDTNSQAADISRIVTDSTNIKWVGSFNGSTPSLHTFKVDSDNNYIHVGSPANGITFGSSEKSVG